MKRMTLLVTLVLALVLAMPVIARDRHCEGIETHPYQIYGVLEGTILYVPFPNATSPMDVDSLSHSSGVVRGLGRTNMFTFHRPLPDGSGVMDGHFKIVTASHDTLQGYYDGGTLIQDPEPPYQISGNIDFVITGGTGRFADASGTIHITGYITPLGFDVLEWPVTYVLEGTVDY